MSGSSCLPRFATFIVGAQLVFAGSALAPSVDAAVGDWTQINPGGTPPSPRREHSAIYDVAHDRMIVFGGTPGGNTPQTWELDWDNGPVWTQLYPSVSPNALGGAAAIYDPVRHRMVIFGGWTASSTVTNEVWTLSLDNPDMWVQIGPQGQPPSPRSFAVAVYDPVGDRMIMFSGTPAFNDVWALTLGDSPTWTQIIPTGILPRVRWGSSGAYDPGQNRLVISDGYPSAGPDAWALPLATSSQWVQLPPPSFSPASLVGATAVYDPNAPSMLVYGGLGSSNNPDTWAMTLGGPTVWSVLPHNTPLPPQRRFHSAIYRAATSEMIVFGGFDDVGQTFRNDLWSLQRAVPIPVIGSFSPMGGVAGGQVTIRGQYLSQVTSVTFGGVEASFTATDDLTLSAFVPSGAATGPIRVTSAGGTATTATTFFVE